MQVKVIALRGQAALVEWIESDGGARRATVPVEAVVDGVVNDALLAYALPYGLPWEELYQIRVTPEAVARELRKRGIWTLADLHQKPNEAAAAIRAAANLDVAALRLAAETYDGGERE